MATTAELYDLQKIDTLWLQVRRRLQQIQKQLGENDELLAARKRVKETEAALHEWHGQQTDAELESQSLANRIQDTDARLMSGQVSNPKELESLQASAEALQRQQASIEDKGVEALLHVETLTTQLVDERSILADLDAEWKASQGALLEEEQKMKRNYVILKRKRESAAKAMDAASLQEYERLRKRKAGIAVTAIEGESCGACNVTLPTGVSSAARDQGRLVNCPSCGRILFGG